MAGSGARLGAVDVKGGLWGADLLAAIADDRARLPADTISPVSYQLPAKASSEQATRAAWTILTAAWDEFTERHTARLERDGTDAYGDDTFTFKSWTRQLLSQLGYVATENPPGGLVLTDADDPDSPGDSFPITHLHAAQVPLHLLAAGVPLDTRTTGVAGAHHQSPHSLVQDYLNRTPRHLWAIITNGLTFRILRDNAALSRQAYIEFDLAAIFDDSAYADFALLWHAAHATRFTHDADSTPSDCIAERWQDHSTQTGVAALDDLRDGVEAAVAEIGQGLIEHPANVALRAALDDPADSFDAAALYRELLYVAYRHVFWFTLDDRNLLHPADADRTKVALYRDYYASTQLRTKARRHLGAHHPDGWQHLLTVSSWFAAPNGQPDLDLPGLLGRLWDADVTRHVNGTTLTNRRYYEALRRLGYVARDNVLQRINYDAMGSEELGAVYEALLEIRPTADTSRRKFVLGRTAGSDRKKTGSYYTPTSLINVLLDEALDPVLDERIKQAVDGLPADATHDQRRLAREDALLTTTVCDPAMGSAHFLVGAGMRMAKRLAQLRTDEIEPSPAAVQQAFRDVASRCLYGVDLNPMAVELAKVAIWLECHVPGQPLTFLDHHLKHGNALLGVGFDPDLIAWHRSAKKATDQKGVPDAAFEPLAGDDKVHARLLRERNRNRRGGGGQLRLGAGTHNDRFDRLTETSRKLTELTDETPDALAIKQRAWADYRQDPELARQRLRADAWMASWSFQKATEVSARLSRGDALAADDLPWDIYYDTFLDEELDLSRPGIRAVRDATRRNAFFHWYLEFPDVAEVGGFSVMLGNPPWERVKLAEKEWFAAAGYEQIATAKDAGRRKKLIAELAVSLDELDQATFARWQEDLHVAEVLANFASTSTRFPLGGVGDINTYPLFADHFIQSHTENGRSGIIVKSGLVKDITYQAFFSTLVDERRLVSVYDFENRGLFPGVDSRERFCLITTTGASRSSRARFAFLLTNPVDAGSPETTYELTPEEIALVNPETRLAPAFTTPSHARRVLDLNRRHRSLGEVARVTGTRAGFILASVDEVKLKQSPLPLPTVGSEPVDGYSPVLEGKLIWIGEHRAATYVDHETTREFTREELVDPTVLPATRHVMLASEFQRKRAVSMPQGTKFLLAWRNITNPTNERTTVTVALPAIPVDNTFNLAFPHSDALTFFVQGITGTFAFDYILRQTFNGTNLKAHTLLAVPHPEPVGQCPWDPASTVHDWVTRRSAALSATSSLMAREMGLSAAVQSAPSARSNWRSELDAAALHLFGYRRDEIGEVMETFAVLARRDRRAEGLAEDDESWLTRRLVTAKYDELGHHARAGTTYVSTDAPPPLPDRLCLPIDAEVSGAP